MEDPSAIASTSGRWRGVGSSPSFGAGDGKDTVLTHLFHGPGASLCLGLACQARRRSESLLPLFPCFTGPSPLTLQLLLQRV
jgi:hypothetical protein